MRTLSILFIFTKMNFFALFLIIYLNIHRVFSMNNENNLDKYKTELHQISFDVENFIFDVAKEVFKNADNFFSFNYDNGNSKSDEETDKNSGSFETDPVNNEIEDSKRRKRAVDDNILGAEEEILDKDKHIKDIKEELRKLYELVRILKDQQTILSILHEKHKEINDLPEESDPKILLKVLEQINNNLNEEKEFAKNLPTQKELEILKIDLRKAILNLNQTKNALKQEKEKDIKLEKELNHQQEQINLLKALLNKVISKNIQPNAKIIDEAVKDDKEIVGAPIFIPKDLPKLKHHEKIKLDISKTPDHSINYPPIRKQNNGLEHSEKINEDTNKDVIKINPVKEDSDTSKIEMTARSSDLSDLFDQSDKSKSNGIEIQIRGLENKLDTQNKEENIKKETSIIRKMLEQDKPSSRSFTNDDVDLLKKLLKLTDDSDKPQVKIDNDIDDELKKLEIAINTLKPSGKFNILDSSSSREQPINKESTVTLSTDKIMELRKKLDDIINMQAKKDIKNILSIGDSSWNLDSKHRPNPYPFWYRPYSTEAPQSPYDYPVYPNFFDPFYPQFPYLPQEPDNVEFEENFGSNLEPKPLPPPSSGVNKKKQDLQAPEDFPFNRDAEVFQFNQRGSTGHLPQQLENSIEEDSKIKFIHDLINEINDLENIIGNMKSKTDENLGDKSTLNELEKEVRELKNIINGISQKIDETKPKIDDNIKNQLDVPQRHKRSVEKVEKSNKIPTEEKDSDMKLYDDLTAKLREYLVEENKPRTTEENKNARNVEFEDIRERINKIKSQLGFNPSTREQSSFYDSYKKPSYDEYNKNLLNIKPYIIPPPKKDDFLTEILLKILDKVIAAIPKILGKLFGASIQGLVDKVDYDKNTNNQYGVSYNDYDNKNLESVFYSLGSFGYIPLILLKLLNVCSTFVNALKKNKFIKNFLVPGIVLLIVSGAVIFLIWWFKGDDETNMARQIGFEKQRISSGEFDKYRNPYTGTDYYNNNYRNTPYPMSFYEKPYYTYSNKYPNSNGYYSRTVNEISPGLYYRTYFEDSSKNNT